MIFRLRHCLVFACFAPFLAAQQQTKPLFTEDFESGSLNPTIWTQRIDGQNAVEVQSERAAHGKYALRVRCPEGAQRTFALAALTDVPASLRQHHFGRAYVYVSAKLPARHTILITAGTEGFPKNKYEEVASLNGRFQLTYVDQLNGGEDWHSGGSDIPVGRWFLLEWEFNNHPNSAAVWVDGEKIYESGFKFKDAGSDGLVGAFNEVSFGFRLWGLAPNAFDIYYDDIALSDNRIGPVKSN